MTRKDWTEIAHTFARLQMRLLDHARRSRQLRREHIVRAEGVELAARAICRTLRSRSGRFDGRRFMQIATGRK